MFKRIIKSINDMWFGGNKNNIFYLLLLRRKLYHISYKQIPQISFVSYDDLLFIYSDFNDLVVDSRIIKISSQQKENQYGSDNIIIENREDKNTRKNYCKKQIP